MNPLRMATVIALAAAPTGRASVAPLRARLVTTHERFLENRRDALPGLSDPYGTAPLARVVLETPRDGLYFSSHPWKRNVVATVFWIGEQPTENNPTPNTCSAWDANWQENYGGCDDPDRRVGWLPAGFIPQLNPFYVALPYNDVMSGGVHRPEASRAIPWFWQSFRSAGVSVCKGRWILIHHAGRVCYAQWEDVGPFVVDHWQYVFGQENPRTNRNQSAGIDLSPAVRDYLELRSGQRVEWRFVENDQVPDGPWLNWSGEPPLPR